MLKHNSYKRDKELNIQRDSYLHCKIFLSKEMKKMYNLSLIRKASFLPSFVVIILTAMKAFIDTLGLTIVTSKFIDRVTLIISEKKDSYLIYGPLLLLIGILLFNNIIGTLLSFFNMKIKLDIEKYYKPIILKKQATLDYNYMENNKSREIISRVSTIAYDTIFNNFSALMTLLTIIIYIVSILGMILIHAWFAALIILIFSIPMLKLSLVTGKKTYEASRNTEQFRRRADYFESLLTNRENAEERTIFQYEKRIVDEWLENYEKNRKIQLKSHLKYMILTKSSTVSMSLIAIIISIALIPAIISGNISVGLYMGLIGSVLSVTHQIGWDMSRAVETLAKSAEFAKEFIEFNDMKSDDNYLCKPLTEKIELTSIEFKNVKFKYPNSVNYTLKGVSFKLENGKHYALVGKNGAGKTTITKLLTGLYDDYEGEILINNKELRNYSNEQKKSFFSIVYQDFAKYSLSIKENIALGNVNMSFSDSDIHEIAKYVELDDYIDSLPAGMDTMLGKISEKGQDASGGQWQKIAIARSVINNAPFKILDEPTSALDPIAESRIYNEFKIIMDKVSTLFISHRLGSTKLADEIIVIDDGIVVEQGSHDELIEKKGKYANMFEIQKEWYK